MRPLRALAIYIAVVFLGGALLAPWLYWLTQSLANSFPHLAHAPFHRFVNRAILGLALLGLWPLLKNLGMNSWYDVGVVRPTGQWKKFFGGILLGFVSLAVVAGLALALGARELNGNISSGQIAEKLAGAAATAIIVATLEEILFRGALFGSLRKVFHWTLALGISSMIYAIVHYFESAKDPVAVTWSSGLELLPRMLGNMADVRMVVPGFFNLTLAGAILGWAYQRTGNLSFSIGLHTGWIFWVKSYYAVTVSTRGINEWCWGTGRMAVVNGWVALPVLVATLLVFARFVRGKTSNIEHPTSNIQ